MCVCPQKGVAVAHSTVKQAFVSRPDLDSVAGVGIKGLVTGEGMALLHPSSVYCPVSLLDPGENGRKSGIPGVH